jgi:hypothetical protein
MPKSIQFLAFAALGFVMFGWMTYFAAIYGLLGLFSKALCVMILLTALAGWAAKP